MLYFYKNKARKVALFFIEKTHLKFVLILYFSFFYTASPFPQVQNRKREGENRLRNLYWSKNKGNYS